MGKAIFGNTDGAGLVLYKGYPTLTRSGNSWEVIYKYWCAADHAESLIPDAYGTCPHTNHGTLTLQETQILENGTAGMCDVILTYRFRGITQNINAKAGDTQKSISTTWQEVPLDDERLWTSGVITEAQAISLRKKGHISWGMGAVEYTYTEWHSSFTWSEANVIGTVGDESDPTGMTSPTANKWMLVAHTIRTDGDVIEETKTWRYNQKGWKP